VGRTKEISKTSRVIRVDPEVHQSTINIQTKLMVAVGHFVSTNDAIKFFFKLKENHGRL